jgi:hypothetical protein
MKCPRLEKKLWLGECSLLLAMEAGRLGIIGVRERARSLFSCITHILIRYKIFKLANYFIFSLNQGKIKRNNPLHEDLEVSIHLKVY